MNSGVSVHISREFAGLKTGQTSLFWEAEQRLFEEATAFLNDEYCRSGHRSSPRTWKNVAHALAFWFNWCAEADVDWRTASQDDLIDFRDGLSTAISTVTGDAYGSGTIVAYMQPVIAFYDHARKHKAYFGDLCSGNALKSKSASEAPLDMLSDASELVPSRRAKKNVIRPFQTGDMKKFLTVLGPTASERVVGDLRPCRDRLMADWGWAVGLRLSEIMTINSYQFLTLHPEEESPFSHQPIEVIGKGNVARNVAVPNWLITDTLDYMGGERAQALELGRKKRRKIPNVLFVTGNRSQDPGSPFTPRRFETIVEKACISAGLMRMKQRIDSDSGLSTLSSVANHCVHDLRHTYAVYTYWIEVGNGNSEPWKVIQAQLGHECLKTTIRTYLKFVQLFGPRGTQDIRSLVGLKPNDD
ncbi:MAG: site-specific integrase [Rhodanobacter sp.]